MNNASFRQSGARANCATVAVAAAATAAAIVLALTGCGVDGRDAVAGTRGIATPACAELGGACGSVSLSAGLAWSTDIGAEFLQ